MQALINLFALCSLTMLLGACLGAGLWLGMVTAGHFVGFKVNIQKEIK